MHRGPGRASPIGDLIDKVELLVEEGGVAEMGMLFPAVRI
jgi:hypothetical protein